MANIPQSNRLSPKAQFTLTICGTLTDANKILLADDSWNMESLIGGP